MKKVIHLMEDLFPVVLALIFVAVIILTVCHATSSMQKTAKQSSFLSHPDQTCVQRDQPKADHDVENALRSGEWEMLVSPVVP